MSAGDDRGADVLHRLGLDVASRDPAIVRGGGEPSQGGPEEQPEQAGRERDLGKREGGLEAMGLDGAAPRRLLGAHDSTSASLATNASCWACGRVISACRRDVACAA